MYSLRGRGCSFPTFGVTMPHARDEQAFRLRRNAKLQLLMNSRRLHWFRLEVFGNWFLISAPSHSHLAIPIPIPRIVEFHSHSLPIPKSHWTRLPEHPAIEFNAQHSTFGHPSTRAIFDKIQKNATQQTALSKRRRMAGTQRPTHTDGLSLVRIMT